MEPLDLALWIGSTTFHRPKHVPINLHDIIIDKQQAQTLRDSTAEWSNLSALGVESTITGGFDTQLRSTSWNVHYIVKHAIFR